MADSVTWSGRDSSAGTIYFVTYGPTFMEASGPYLDHAFSKVGTTQVLVLASGSRTRARLLGEAGIAIEISAASIDEAEIRAGLRRERASAEFAAETLAELKAMQVSRRFPGRLVLGADQMLECEGDWLDKPVDLAAARAQLRQLRGRAHLLLSSAILVKDAIRIWHHAAKAVMIMREFSDQFLDEYLAKSGDRVLDAVGSYRLEALGVQLFRRIEGDYFSVLGLPLLAVIDALREHGLARR